MQLIPNGMVLRRLGVATRGFLGHLSNAVIKFFFSKFQSYLDIVADVTRCAVRRLSLLLLVTSPLFSPRLRIGPESESILDSASMKL